MTLLDCLFVGILSAVICILGIEILSIDLKRKIKSLDSEIESLTRIVEYDGKQSKEALRVAHENDTKVIELSEVMNIAVINFTKIKKLKNEEFELNSKRDDIYRNGHREMKYEGGELYSTIKLSDADKLLVDCIDKQLGSVRLELNKLGRAKYNPKGEEK